MKMERENRTESDQKIIRPQTNFFFFILPKKKNHQQKRAEKEPLCVFGSFGIFFTEECSHNEMVIFQLQFKFEINAFRRN